MPGPPIDTSPSFSPHSQQSEERIIASAAIEGRTSGTLEDFRQLIIDARDQRRDVSTLISKAEAHKVKLKSEKAWKGFLLWRNLFKERLAALVQELIDVDNDLGSLQESMSHSQVSADFEIAETAGRTFGAVCAAFEELRQCAKIWHIPTERDVDRARTRSAAAFSVRRNPVSVGYQICDLLSSDSTPLRFQNPDGEDIFIYPSMAVMPRSDGAFALIDLRELVATLHNQPFVEDEAVPTDAQIVRYAWEKSNRDGSRDKRFTDNKQIPVCLYGELNFASKGGVQERYSFSNPVVAAKFAGAFAAHARALSALSIP